MTNESIREKVREEYAQAALRVTNQSGSCCGSAAPAGNPITSNLYADGETTALPAEAIAASLGCGNPTALGLTGVTVNAMALIAPWGIPLCSPSTRQPVDTMGRLTTRWLTSLRAFLVT